MPLANGTRIGAYEILGVLGAGGMGQVYRARDTKLGRDVAIKALPSETASNPAARARFEREARAVAALSHPHIVTIHDIFQWDGQDFIVMELVPGDPLDRIITEHGLPVGQAVELALQIATALEAAHGSGVVHRDIKPSNIVVSSGGQAKVLDFGLAKLPDRTDPGAATVTAALATEVGAVMGTMAYMSPEQAKGQPVDAATDVFSFGAVLYEMLTGRRAFAGPSSVETLARILDGSVVSLTSIRKDLPPELVRLIDACLQKDRKLRPAAADLVARLKPMTAGTASPRRRGRALIALGAAAVIAAAVIGGWQLKLKTDESRRTAAVADVRRLMTDGRMFDAFERARALHLATPGDAAVVAVWKELSRPLAVTSDPPGAEFAISPIGEARWVVLGQTPLADLRVPRGNFQERLSKPGFENSEDIIPGAVQSVAEKLTPAGKAPPGMVRSNNRVPPALYLVPGADPVDVTIPDFWIDRLEVTNREYKRFVDAGGYQRREFWTRPFEQDGRPLGWDDAMRLFRDATGRPGPATWQVGAYPDGEDDMPVTGVSWYEADAYLTFAGKRLPTLPHWFVTAAYVAVADVLPRANLAGRGLMRGGTGSIGHRFGARDLAGNVKEWLINPAGGHLRYIVGGAWNEPSYMFVEPDARSPLERAANFGIRGVRLDDADHSYDTLARPFPKPDRDYAAESPVGDAVFAAYRRFFAYDRAPIKAAVKTIRDDHAVWRVDRVSFPAAYDGETMAVLMFLPKQVQPPWQTVLYQPGAGAFTLRSSQREIDVPYFAHVLRSGRAVAFPIVKGTYERGTDQFTQTTSKQGTLWRDYSVAMYKDIARTLDYLETRSDIARDKIGFLGVSRGGALAPMTLALEPDRLKTAALMIPGLYLSRMAPEVDIFNFLPRVRQPVLVMNGRFDFIFPEQRSQLPFFQRLGTPADRKLRVVMDTGHVASTPEMIRQTLDWLDKTLGPVK